MCPRRTINEFHWILGNRSIILWIHLDNFYLYFVYEAVVTWLELLYFTTFRRAMNPSIFISTVYETCQICYVLARMFRILRHIEQACQLVKCTFKNVTLILPCWIFEIKTIISVSDPSLCCDNVPCINIISQMHYHSRIQHNCFMPSLAFFSAFFIGFLW